MTHDQAVGEVRDTRADRPEPRTAIDADTTAYAGLPAKTAATTPLRRSAPVHRLLMRLQTQAGNRAVQRMLLPVESPQAADPQIAPPAGPKAQEVGAAAPVAGRSRPLVQRDSPSSAGPLQLPPGPSLPSGVEMVPLNQLEFTQADISNTFEETETGRQVSVGRMAARMRLTGWDRNRPATVVRMPNGRLVSLDHRRLWAAQQANVREVSVRIHNANDKMPDDQARRFEIRRRRVPSGVNTRTGNPWRRGDRPVYWGDAVRFRSATQQFADTVRLTTAGPFRGQPANATRDPSFPAEGSPGTPMRLPPRLQRPSPPRLHPSEAVPANTAPPPPGSPLRPRPEVPRSIEPAPVPSTSPTGGSRPLGVAIGVASRLLSVLGVVSTILQAIDYAQHINDPNTVMTALGTFVNIQSLPVDTRVECWSTYPPMRGTVCQTNNGHKYIRWDDLST